MAKTGKPMLDGIGATEMLHIFITNRFDDHQPACTGRPVTGYEARIVDEDMQPRCRAARSGGWPCAARPAAATWPTTGSANMWRTAGT
jgi:acyl-coenzyme A synthetase/AMP-(fatty) acid ligase